MENKLPQGWEVKKLGEVCEIRPQKKESKESLKNDELVSFVPMECLQIDNSNLLLKETRKLEEVYKGYTYFAENDVLLAKITPCFENGKLGIAKNLTNKVGFGSSEFYVFRPSEKILPEFLYHFLNRSQFRKDGKSRMSGAVGHKRVTKDFIEGSNINFPPLPEQKRIVAILDEAFEAIDKVKANTQKNLQNARELFQSYLQQTFSNKGDDWEVRKLEEITSKLGDGLHGTPKYTEDGDYHFINGNNLKDGLIVFKKQTKRVSIEEYKKYKKDLNYRTVLVSINGTLGNVAFYKGEKVILGKSACYFNLNDNVDKSFIKYAFSSPYFIKYAHMEATGATIKNVSLKTMRNFLVPLPPLPEQKRIVTELDKLSEQTKRLEAIYQQKLDDLDELKQSILQKAFTGELSKDERLAA